MPGTTEDNGIFRFARAEESAALAELNPYCHGQTLARKSAAQEIVVVEDAASGEIAGVIRFECIWTTVPDLHPAGVPRPGLVAAAAGLPDRIPQAHRARRPAQFQPVR